MGSLPYHDFKRLDVLSSSREAASTITLEAASTITTDITTEVAATLFTCSRTPLLTRPPDKARGPAPHLFAVQDMEVAQFLERCMAEGGKGEEDNSFLLEPGIIPNG